jgi:glutaredoxin
MRCNTHDLALGPDGRCVLCRDTAPPHVPSSRIAGTALAAVALVALVAVAVNARRTPEANAEKVIAPASAPVVPVSKAHESSPAIAEQSAEIAALERVAPASPPARIAEANALPAPLETGVQPALPAAPIPTAVAPAPPSEAAIQSALRATSIVMFATDWCGHCKRARAFFDANGIQHVERDIDRDPRALAELKNLTGKAGIPVFLIDGVLVSGFGEGSMKRALLASVEKRLGVRGIRAQREGAR